MTLLVQLVLVLVEVADEVLDAAVVLEGDAVGLAALVDQLDLQAAGEEGGLAQALGQGVEVEADLFEDLEVGQEGDLGAVLLGRLALGQVGHRFAALVVLRPDVAVAADLQVQALGERVDDGDADAVQAAGDLVAAAVPELAAGVEDGQHDLGRGALLFLHRLDRDAAAVVGDRAAVVRVEDDADAVAVAGEGLVDGVVDDLVDEVVEAAGAGRADVHAGTLADRFQSLEDGDVLGAVGRRTWRCWLFSQAMSPFRLTQKTPTPGGSLHTGRGLRRVAIRIPVECCGSAGAGETNSLQIVDKLG